MPKVIHRSALRRGRRPREALFTAGGIPVAEIVGDVVCAVLERVGVKRVVLCRKLDALIVLLLCVLDDVLERNVGSLPEVVADVEFPQVLVGAAALELFENEMVGVVKEIFELAVIVAVSRVFVEIDIVKFVPANPEVAVFVPSAPTVAETVVPDAVYR